MVRRRSATCPRSQSAWETGKLAGDPQLTVFGDQLEERQAPPAMPTWEQVAAAIDSEVEKVVKGATPVQDAVADMQRKAQSIGTGRADRWPSPPPAGGRPRPPGGPGRRTASPIRRQQAVAAWLLAIPFVLLFLVFTAGPVLACLGMSFTDISPGDLRTPLAVNFVGLENYTAAAGRRAVPQGRPEHRALRRRSASR